MNLADKLTARTSYRQYYARFQALAQRPAARVSGLAILTVFTVVFFIAFAIMPTFKNIAALKKDIKDSKQIEAKLQQKIYSLNQAETLMAKVAPQLSLLEQVLPADPSLERLVWQLNWLARQNNVTLTSGSISAFEPDFIPLDLIIKGSYLNIKKFIAGLNQIDRLIEVSSLTINAKTVQTDTGISAALKLKADYLPANL